MAQMFEQNQTFLQSSTENLSHFLENEVHLLSDKNKNKKVWDTVNFCQRHCDQLIEHVREGKEKNKWNFRNI